MDFTHKVPREMQQEDRWFKIFSPKQAIAAGICFAMVIASGSFLNKLIGTIPMIAIEVVFVLIFGVCMFLTIPNSKYMIGGGHFAIQIVLRCIIRSLNKKVYVKHLDEEVDI